MVAQLNSEITNCRDQNCSGKSAMTRKVVIFFISRLCNSRKTSKWTHLGLFHPTIYNPPRHNFRSEFPSLSENTPQPLFSNLHRVARFSLRCANCELALPNIRTRPHTHTIIHFLFLSLRFFLYISMCSEYMPICAGLVLLVC